MCRKINDKKTGRLILSAYHDLERVPIRARYCPVRSQEASRSSRNTGFSLTSMHWTPWTVNLVKTDVQGASWKQAVIR